jgi:Ca2+-binding RTX toxin-like protein
VAFRFGSRFGDNLTGGGRNDWLFGNGKGDDTVVGFATAAGSDDVLDNSAFGFADLAAVQAASTQMNDDLVIALDGDDSVILLDVELSDLHVDDFIL